jgi:hypothetical protein
VKCEETAWAAGLVDGEGCIHIMRGTTHPKRKTIAYSMYLQVRMAHKPAIVRLQDIFGCGHIKLVQPQERQWKPTWLWHVSALPAAAVLQQMLPWLCVKQEEARVALAFQQLQSNRPKKNLRVPPDVEAQYQQYYEEMRALKRQTWAA